MSVLLLISEVLKALAAFLTYKNSILKYEVRAISEKKINQLITDIEKARDLKTEDGALRADFLRGQLIKEKEKYENLATD